MRDGESVVVGCIVESRKNKTTKRDQQMAFLTIEDAYASVECIVFPKILQRYSGLLSEGAVLMISGTVSQREDEEPKLLLNNAEPLNDALRRGTSMPQYERPNTPEMPKAKRERLFIRVESATPELFSRLREALMPFSGDVEVRIYLSDEDRYVRMPRELYFNGSPAGVRELKYEFGDENVVLK